MAPVRPCSHRHDDGHQRYTLRKRGIHDHADCRPVRLSSASDELDDAARGSRSGAAMIGWLRAHENWMWWLVVISAFTFVVSLLAVPWLLVRIPPRYFMSTNHAHPWGDQHPVVHVLLLIGKNLLGVILIVLGLVMLVLPGQGILTILA